jgi:hypothetical protein
VTLQEFVASMAIEAQLRYCVDDMMVLLVLLAVMP